MKLGTTTYCICCRNYAGTNHKIDDESNYQELSESKGDNTYQTLTLAMLMSLDLYHDANVFTNKSVCKLIHYFVIHTAKA